MLIPNKIEVFSTLKHRLLFQPSNHISFVASNKPISKMTNYIENLNKPLANLNELYDVIFDAYRKGIVLHYCFKCFQTFLAIEER